jgi:hypothetical protein
MLRAFGLVLALLAVPALGSAATLRAHLRRPRHGLQVRLTPITIAPHSEREVCQLVTLRNRKAMDASEITMAMPGGATYTSHHFAVFLYQGDHPEDIPSGPFDRVGCAGVGDQVVSPILAFVQRIRQTIRFPPGVAVALPPHQPVLLNSHYLNGGDEPVTIDVAVNFRAARKGTVRHHARSFQLGTFDIDVPPGQPGSASASWVTPFPLNVVWLSTHSHKHTQSADVEVTRQGVIGPLELETRVYSEPTVKLYDPPLRLEAGDGYHWTCNYLNDTTRELTFGVTSNDEMCFTVGFFYPDDDAGPLPAVPGCFGGGGGLVCPFNH